MKFTSILVASVLANAGLASAATWSRSAELEVNLNLRASLAVTAQCPSFLLEAKHTLLGGLLSKDCKPTFFDKPQECSLLCPDLNLLSAQVHVLEKVETAAAVKGVLSCGETKVFSATEAGHLDAFVWASVNYSPLSLGIAELVCNCVDDTLEDVGNLLTGDSKQGPGIGGDPHIKTWSGDWYDYQGECDLVFLHAPAFSQGLGLDVHVRTKSRYDYSYISHAALKIGDDILEIASYGDYLLNGVGGAELPATISGFPVSYSQTSTDEHVFVVELDNEQMIRFKVFKDLVTIKLDGSTEADFGDSVGMMGSFSSGELVSRNGTVLGIEDPNAFAQEWQVRDTEDKLFQTLRAPQFPAQCVLPADKQAKKNLRA